jgi:hypothetical protein
MKRIYRKILRELHPDELSLLRRDQECFTVGLQNSRAIAADDKLFLFEKGTLFRDLWDELVAGRFGDQDARGCCIFLHLLP